MHGERDEHRVGKREREYLQSKKHEYCENPEYVTIYQEVNESTILYAIDTFVPCCII